MVKFLKIKISIHKIIYLDGKYKFFIRSLEVYRSLHQQKILENEKITFSFTAVRRRQ